MFCTYKHWIIFLCCILCFFSVTAAPMAYLCGPNEDGCSSADTSSCLCMPVDASANATPYCLDFNTLSCLPMTPGRQCISGNVLVSTQSRCLALAFQSEELPACKEVPVTFCVNQHIALCAKDGGPSSCASG